MKHSFLRLSVNESGVRAYTVCGRFRNNAYLKSVFPKNLVTTMKTRALRHWLRYLLANSATHRYYPLVVAAIAFVSTVTFSFPFAAVLIPAVLLGPRRWIIIGLLCGMASGVGAALLVEIFHHMGREVVLSRYPQLIELQSWRWTSNWLQNYGLIALLIIAASPVPQTPALFLCALAELSVPGILIVVSIGKTAKYLFLAGATARYPARFLGIGKILPAQG